MSRWAFSLQMDAGLSLLAGHLVKIILRTDGPRLYLNVGEAGESNSCEGNVFSAILQAVGAHAFSAAGKGCTITSVPAPWSVWIKPTSMPTPQDLLGAELALELWLLPSEDINDLDGARKSLEARRSSLNEDTREALAYWLLGSTHPLGGRPDLKNGWRADTQEVLVIRSTDWARRRRPPEPLLAAAQILLEELTQLRKVATTITSYDKLIDSLEVIIDPLPDAFRQAIWWEAGYQLAARGLHQEANIATQHYRNACDRLKARLPGLIDGGIPGFGVSVGQRAYYSGEFGIALSAYQKEWVSGSKQHRSRLKRLIANVFSDLGALAAARRLAEGALAEQEISGDPETYKTIGRCGEIALRSGNIDEAADLYQRSQEAQRQLLGAQEVEGRTTVYRGHVALLAGNLDEAADRYAEAHGADALKDSRLNAYALMGEAALALHRRDTAAATACLDRLEGTDELSINGDALPRAVVILSAIALGVAPREKGLAAITALIDDNYMAETLALLPLVYRHVGMANKELNRIAETLQQWEKALLAVPELVGERVDDDPTPKVLLTAIAEVKRRGNWQALAPLRARIFPTNLISTAKPIA